MLTAVEDRFLNKISDFPSKGNQALETAGVLRVKKPILVSKTFLGTLAILNSLVSLRLKITKMMGSKNFGFVTILRTSVVKI